MPDRARRVVPGAVPPPWFARAPDPTTPAPCRAYGPAPLGLDLSPSSWVVHRYSPSWYPPGYTPPWYPPGYTPPRHPPDDHQFYMPDQLEQSFLGHCRRT